MDKLRLLVIHTLSATTGSIVRRLFNLPCFRQAVCRDTRERYERAEQVEVKTRSRRDLAIVRLLIGSLIKM